MYKELHCEPKLVITFDGSDKCLHGGFCKGIYQLLKGIEEHGALFSSCRDMNMAYSKAWKIIKEFEEALGTKIIEKKTDHNAGGQYVTDIGKKFIKEYERCYKLMSKSISNKTTFVEFK